MANPLYDSLFGRHAGSQSCFLRLPNGDQLSYAGFLTRAARFSGALMALGLQPGDRVAAQIDKSPDALALYAACAQTGVVFLPLNPAYTPSEVDYFVSNSGATLLIARPQSFETLTGIAARSGAKIETLGDSGDGSFAQRSEGQPATFDTRPCGPEDLAAILYTSGTTGRSKGAMLSQRNLISNAQTLAKLWQFTDQDVLLHALPIFHTHGLFVATNVTLVAGGQMIFLPKPDVDALIQHLPDATTMMGVPTFYTRLLADPRFTAQLTKDVRLFVSGSAPLLADTHQQFEARTGHRILERYGMTETNMNTSNPYDGDRRPGTVGTALPGVEVKVCDPAGRALPNGQTGVLEVRGPNVFLGYWRMPEKTAEELRPTGFFITGDLAVQGPDGYVTIVGRAKDLIISGGYNVYPKEIEEVLDALPNVVESAVIGLPHPDLGEAVMAVVVLKSGSVFDRAAVQAALGDQLARFKQPRHIELMPDLPRNTMGKVQKAELRRTFGHIFQPQDPA